MNHQIRLMSQYAFSILNNANTGTIHSVYRKTINLKIGDYLVALQAGNSPLSPISLITELDETSMNALNIIQGMPVSIQGSSIKISSYTFDFSETDIVCLKPDFPLNIASQQHLKESLKQILLSVQTGGFDTIFQSYWNQTDDLPSLILEGARNYMSKCLSFYNMKNYANAASTLVRLIGLGTGLTPSGDDFLCGVLAGFALTDKMDSIFSLSLRTEIEKHLCDTNDISRAFLICALNGQYSLPVNALFKEPSIDEITDSFQKIGHSSGIDTLCGIFYILSITT